jgi:hypothetical protein
MSTSNETSDELAARGESLFDQCVRPFLRPADDGKYVAIDVNSGDYVVDSDDHAAVMRLLADRPAADIWLMRAGFPTTYRIGLVT